MILDTLIHCDCEFTYILQILQHTASRCVNHKSSLIMLQQSAPPIFDIVILNRVEPRDSLRATVLSFKTHPP